MPLAVCNVSFALDIARSLPNIPACTATSDEESLVVRAPSRRGGLHRRNRRFFRRGEHGDKEGPLADEGQGKSGRRAADCEATDRAATPARPEVGGGGVRGLRRTLGPNLLPGSQIKFLRTPSSHRFVHELTDS